ncbi:PAS domain-containing sensor histidine kinase [Dongia deserti]|uniref:PAS domain-containing sensor histidine kinase n=1 Tax=Dongia deserti TaxID=2268030 RepID=UPI0013C5288F|nr:PAS domain-containing sensor histidine kinase [Dongia deserti]
MASNEPFSGPADEEISRLLRLSSVVPVTIAAWETGALLHANDAAAAMFGTSAEALSGRSILEFYVEPERRGALLRDIDAGTGGTQKQVQLRRADGSTIWVKVAAQRVSYRGTPSVFKISHDITEHMDRARQLAEAQEKLSRQASNLNSSAQTSAEAASRAKSTFLAQMSHELRSPLNAILGFSEVVRGLHFGRDQVDKYAEYGGYIHQAGTHLLALIDDILDLAKVEAGKLELKRTPFDLVELLDECARMMRPMIDGRGLKLQVYGTAASLMLTADRRRTKQMVINLLSNAIKFTHPGGKVEMAVQRTPDQAIAVTVSDTGIGMSQAEIAVALEPFGRVGNAAATDPTGSGLGLPIVKNLIEAHGGKLQILSELNRGTIARLIFPAQS